MIKYYLFTVLMVFDLVNYGADIDLNKPNPLTCLYGVYQNVLRQAGSRLTPGADIQMRVAIVEERLTPPEKRITTRIMIIARKGYNYKWKVHESSSTSRVKFKVGGRCAISGSRDFKTVENLADYYGRPGLSTGQLFDQSYQWQDKIEPLLNVDKVVLDFEVREVQASDNPSRAADKVVKYQKCMNRILGAPVGRDFKMSDTVGIILQKNKRPPIHTYPIYSSSILPDEM